MKMAWFVSQATSLFWGTRPLYAGIVYFTIKKYTHHLHDKENIFFNTKGRNPFAYQWKSRERKMFRVQKLGGGNITRFGHFSNSKILKP